MRTRRSAWKPVLAVLAALLAAAAAWVWSVRSEARAILEKRDRDAARRLDELRRRGPARPSLLGGTDPGDATAAYRTAIDEFRTLVSKNQGHRLMTDDDLCIRQLRRAALRRELPWDEDFASKALKLVEWGGQLLICIVDRAWVLHREGRDPDALERLRVALATAFDLERFGTHPEQLGDVEMYVHETTGMILADHALSARDLRLHAQFLDRLEAARPAPDLAVRRALDAGPERIEEPTWRQLWSEDVLRAGLARDAEFLADAVAGLDPAAASPFRAWCDDPNLYERQEGVWPAEQLLRVDAARRAYARLARVAVALAVWEADAGEFPGDVDPWLPPSVRAVCPYSGQALVLRPAEGRAWSFGFDLDDDGGRKVESAEWTHWKHLRYKADGDLAATVRRKR